MNRQQKKLKKAIRKFQIAVERMRRVRIQVSTCAIEITPTRGKQEEGNEKRKATDE
jgi:hypothetical protein